MRNCTSKKERADKIVVGVLLFFLALLGIFLIIKENGRMSLLGKESAQIDSTESENEIYYNGKYYRYKEGCINFLCLGVDKDTDKISDPNANGGMGQSDAIFVVSLDPDEKKMRIIGVPRDTMVLVDEYDVDNNYYGQELKQITLQYAYGDGAAWSCELTQEKVSELFYNLPFNGYCAVNIRAIAVINDSVGGVDVTIEEDLTSLNPDFVEGATLTLDGEQAYSFIKSRDITQSQSAIGRLGRQKQYALAFVDKAKVAMKDDVTLPIELYNELQNYMETDITASELTYLATEIMDYEFSEEDIYTIPVDVIRGEEYEENYVRSDEWYEMVLELFYEEVPQK